MQEPEPARPAPASVIGPAEIAKLQSQRNNGAGWLSAIAAFSIINLLILAFGGDVNFLIGLGITQLINVLCRLFAEQLDPTAGDVLRVAGGAVTVGVAALFLLLGILARRGHLWTFMAGMALYVFDGLIFLWFEDWLSLGFHVFVLLMLAAGLNAQLRLNRLEQPIVEPPSVDAG